MSSTTTTDTNNETPPSNHTAIPNDHNPTNPLINLNISNITKLTTKNYITWSLQMQSLLEGYGLSEFIDGTNNIPPSTITNDNSVIPNPEFTTWRRQDRLLFSAFLGAISQPLQPLLTSVTNSQEAWNVLANTYAKPSRGHIKQLKEQIKTFVKGSKPISEYLQFLKTRADELALLGKPMDDEDLVDKILDGLGEEYKGIIDAVNARETPVSFAELYEKLINQEATLQQHHSASSYPIIANPATPQPPKSWRPSSSPQRSSVGPPGFRPPVQQSADARPIRRPPRPYLGYCQGHTVKNCPLF